MPPEAVSSETSQGEGGSLSLPPNFTAQPTSQGFTKGFNHPQSEIMSISVYDTIYDSICL